MQPRLWKVPVIARNSILNTPAKRVYLIERGNYPDDAINKVKQICKKLLPDGTKFDLDLYEPEYNENGRDVLLWDVHEEIKRFPKKKKIILERKRRKAAAEPD